MKLNRPLFMMTEDDTERYYLLPGQGGRARQRKVWGMLVWGISIGLITGGLLAGTVYLISRLNNPAL